METQHMQILRYLETHKGGITPMDAFHKLRITKLATRISELISKGYRFTKMWEESVGEDGSRTRYMRYFLESNDAEQDNQGNNQTESPDRLPFMV